MRVNREIALLSHIYNIAREWGITTMENPCKGVRKNKETPRDFYARDEAWNAVYAQACPELCDAMDLAYLTAQRPGDVLIARAPDIDGEFLSIAQGKTSKKLRIPLINAAGKTDLGILVDRLIQQRKDRHVVGPYLVTTPDGRRLTASMLRIRFDEARACAARVALENLDETLAAAIRQFQFRDIVPKQHRKLTIWGAHRSCSDIPTSASPKPCIAASAKSLIRPGRALVTEIIHSITKTKFPIGEQGVQPPETR